MSSSTIDVIVSAQDKARAVLRSTDRALRQTRQTLEGMEPAQVRMTQAVGAARMAIQAFAASAAVAAVTALTDMAREGGKTADQYDAVAQRVKGLGGIIAQVKAQTTGTFTRTEVVKAAAQFDAFGLEVALLPKALEQVAKTALRTGDDIDYLSESLVSGIARLSDMRLDNLGLIGVVSQAREALTAQGKAFTDVELRAEALSVALEQLESKNADIDLMDSRAAAIKRFDVAVDDAIDSGKELAGTVLRDLARATGDPIGPTKALVIEVAGLANAANAFGKSLDGVAEGSTRTTENLARIRAAFDKLPLDEQRAALGMLRRELSQLPQPMLQAAESLIPFEARLRAVRVASQTAGTSMYALAQAGMAVRSAFAAGIAAQVKGVAAAQDAFADASARGAKALKKMADAQKAARSGGDPNAEKARLVALQAQIDGMSAVNDFGRAEVALEAELARIELSRASEQEKALQRQVAELKYTADLEKGLERLRRVDEQRADDARRAAEAAKAASDLADEQARARAQGLRDITAGHIAADFNAAASALQHFADIAGADETVGKFGALGGALSEVGSQFADLSRMASIGAGDIAAAASASLGALAPTVAAFGSTVAEKAGIMAAFEVAQGVATAFYNPAESATHFAAAAMFGALAGASAGGVKIGPSGGKSAGGGGFMPSQSSGDSGGGSQSATYVINVGPSQGGMIIGTDQTIARAIAEQMHSARGTGHRAAA